MIEIESLEDFAKHIAKALCWEADRDCTHDLGVSKVKDHFDLSKEEGYFIARRNAKSGLMNSDKEKLRALAKHFNGEYIEGADILKVPSSPRPMEEVEKEEEKPTSPIDSMLKEFEPPSHETLASSAEPNVPVVKKPDITTKPSMVSVKTTTPTQSTLLHSQVKEKTVTTTIPVVKEESKETSQPLGLLVRLKVSPYNLNYGFEDRSHIERLKKQIMNGAQLEITLDQNGEIIDGNQTAVAYYELGLDPLKHAKITKKIFESAADERAFSRKRNTIRLQQEPTRYAESVVAELQVRLQVKDENEVKKLLNKYYNFKYPSRAVYNSTVIEQNEVILLIDGFFETEPISAVSFIAHYLPLLDLPTWLRDVVDSGKLAKGKALLIERTEFPEKVKRKLAKEYITKSENEVKRHIESLKADPTLQDKNEQEIVKTEHSSEELKDESCVIRVDESADADEETETMYKCPHCDHIQPRRMKEKCEKCGREHRPDHKDLVKMPKRR